MELRILQSGAAGSGGSRLAAMARGRGTTRPHLMENKIQCDECVTSVTACSDQNRLNPDHRKTKTGMVESIHQDRLNQLVSQQRINKHKKN